MIVKDNIYICACKSSGWQENACPFLTNLYFQYEMSRWRGKTSYLSSFPRSYLLNPCFWEIFNVSLDMTCAASRIPYSRASSITPIVRQFIEWTWIRPWWIVIRPWWIVKNGWTDDQWKTNGRFMEQILNEPKLNRRKDCMRNKIYHS